MKPIIILEGEIGTDRTLLLHLPDDAPLGRVRVTVEAVEDARDADIDAELEEAIALIARYPNGQGLTAGEIARSPEIGAWKDRTDIGDSVEFIARMRRENRERRMKRD
jgi:hypothetical protein